MTVDPRPPHGAAPGAEPPASKALPWYRHFWPWFILLLLGAAVAASLTTVVIAFVHRDSLVSDDWYEDGTSINRRLEREKNARRLGIRAALGVDDITGEIALELEGEATDGIQRLELAFDHPTQAARDRLLTLVRAPSGHFSGQLESPLVGRWYITLAPSPGPSAPDPESDWRLRQTAQLPSADRLSLGEAKETPP